MLIFRGVIEKQPKSLLLVFFRAVAYRTLLTQHQTTHAEGAVRDRNEQSRSNSPMVAWDIPGMGLVDCQIAIWSMGLVYLPTFS